MEKRQPGMQETAHLEAKRPRWGCGGRGMWGPLGLTGGVQGDSWGDWDVAASTAWERALAGLAMTLGRGHTKCPGQLLSSLCLSLKAISPCICLSISNWVPWACIA